MTPEMPPPAGQGGEQRRPRDAPFGPESRLSVERSLLHLRDPDDALRILALIQENGAGFAAYLMLPDTNLADPDIANKFYETYVDAWERFDQFRADILEGLGWTDALNKFLHEQAIPTGHLLWNHGPIDAQILATYDAVHLDGWWHVFNK